MFLLNRTVGAASSAVWTLALVLCLAVTPNVNAAPVLDRSFGINGLTRIGVLDGDEDVPRAYALQSDGKLLVAGQSAGRQPFNFVIRFAVDGRLDTTFADAGVARFPLAEALLFPTVPQVEQRPDGSILLGSYGSLVKLTPNGHLDTTFGTNGIVGNVGLAHFVQQPDGSVLLVSDTGAAPALVIRLTRLNAQGSRDNGFGANGEMLLGGLPRDFTLTGIGLPPYPLAVVSEPDGGFTALANAAIDNGTYLLLRVTPSGVLDPGFGNGGVISGYDLAKSLEEHLRAQTGIEIVDDDLVLGVVKKDGGFSVSTKNGKTYETKYVLLASGSRRKKLGVPGEKELDGKGVVYCTTCDAPLFDGKEVVVVGGGNSALEGVMDLIHYASKIYLMVRSEALRGDPVTQEKVKNNPKVEILWNTAIEEVQGKDFVTGVRYKNLKTNESKELPLGGVFVEIGLVPNSDFVKDLVALDAQAEVVVDHKTQETSHPGIWAVGDVSDVLYKQNNISAGDAVKAILNIYDKIKKS